MLNVLNTQLFRLKRSKLFWAMFTVCALLPVLGMIISSALIDFFQNAFGDDAAGMMEILQLEGGALTLSSLAQLTQLGSDPALFSLICTSIFLSGEFSGGSIRNMVLANKSRTQIFLSFFSVSLIIGFSYLGVSYVSTLLCYGTVIGFTGVAVADAVTGCITSLLLGLLTITLVQAVVCFFLFITRKTGATVAFPLLVIILAPSIANTIVDIVTIVKTVNGQVVTPAALGWVPLYNVSLFSASKVDGALVGKIILYNAPLAALFAFFGWFAISKADLK